MDKTTVPNNIQALKKNYPNEKYGFNKEFPPSKKQAAPEEIHPILIEGEWKCVDQYLK